ncbi:MAG: SDR family oxidoreductase [Alphaproteobacteria bacterium]
MPSVLIVGASRGIGLEFARQYAADGWRVHATCRDVAHPGKLGEIAGDVHLHELELRDLDQISDLGSAMDGVALDLVVHNAGIYGPRNVTLANLDPTVWAEVMSVNAIAPLAVAQAVIDSVLAGGRKAMAFLSSGMGSIGENTSGGSYIYRTSKAALNAGVRSLAIDYRRAGLTAVVLHPGWVRTDMGGPGATLSPEESVTGMRRVIAGLGPGDSGRFFNHDGSYISW